MISYRIPIVLIIVIIFFTQGCAPTLQPLPHDLVGSMPSQEHLLELLEKRLDSIKTVVAKTRSKITNTTEKISSKQVIILKKPSSLRIDGLSPFGHPALSITTDGNNINIYNYSKHTFYSGQIDDKEVAGLFPVSIEFNYLMDILAGGIPLIDFYKEQSTVDIKNSFYRLNLNGENFKEEIYFDHKLLVPKKATIFRADETILMLISFDDYDNIDGLMMPASISVELPDEHYKMEISYSKIQLNSEIDNNLFILPPEN